MNINNEMRAECARVLTVEIFVPKMQLIVKELRTEGTTRVADAIARAVIGRTDYTRLDDLEDGDVPIATEATVVFKEDHTPRHINCSRAYECRNGSMEERRANMARTLRDETDLYGGCSIHFSKPIRLPYKRYSENNYQHREVFQLQSSRTRDQSTGNSDEYVYVSQLSTGQLGGGSRSTTANPLLVRLWKKFEKLHAHAADGLEFYDTVLGALTSVRTLKKLEEKWKDIYPDFCRINHISTTGTDVSIELVDPQAVKQLNHMLRKNTNDRATALKVAMEK